MQGELAPAPNLASNLNRIGTEGIFVAVELLLIGHLTQLLRFLLLKRFRDLGFRFFLDLIKQGGGLSFSVPCGMYPVTACFNTLLSLDIILSPHLWAPETARGLLSGLEQSFSRILEFCEDCSPTRLRLLRDSSRTRLRPLSSEDCSQDCSQDSSRLLRRSLMNCTSLLVQSCLT